MSYLSIVTQSSDDLRCLRGMCGGSGSGGDSDGTERAQGMRSKVESMSAYLNSKGCVSKTSESVEQIVMQTDTEPSYIY